VTVEECCIKSNKGIDPQHTFCCEFVNTAEKHSTLQHSSYMDDKWHKSDFVLYLKMPGP
jgi:hypothetical protein